VPKRQKSYSVNQEVAGELRKFLEDHKETLTLIGVSNETQLFVVLMRNGKSQLEDTLNYLNQKKQNRKTTNLTRRLQSL
jgi:hypothetical protein